MNFEAATLDDLMHDVFEHILNHGHNNNASKGPNIEVLGCELRLTNPIARVSRTESRGLIFSCLGELFWYLSGSNDGCHIAKYIPKYGTFVEDDGSIHGGYGKRLFNMHEKYNQIKRVIEQLKIGTGTRKAVIQLFDSSDLAEDYKDIPCTLNLQFVVRNKKLHMFTMMRSNDAYIGLPHDIFVFTMLQEMLAKELECGLGIYHHYVASLHIYNKNINSAKRFINEGFQATDSIMDEMPCIGFFSIRNELLKFESEIRHGIDLNINELDLCDYWKDILRLLQFYHKKESGNFQDLRYASEVRKKITNKKYQGLINNRERIKKSKAIKKIEGNNMQKRFDNISDIISGIEAFEHEQFKLAGLQRVENYISLSMQITDSIRRIKFIEEINKKHISEHRKNPHSDIFDPLRAAWLHIRENNKNEAYWLIFLATHFGKHKKEGWKLCADIYGGLGEELWTWNRVSHNPNDFSLWFRKASIEIKKNKPQRKFGNHRKYESLNYNSSRPLQTVVQTYVDWVGVSKDHETRFLELSNSNNVNNKYELFDVAYKSMKGILSFGRTAKFDYLTMLRKFSLQNIEPQNLYLSGATGPKRGTSFLFFGNKDSNYSVEELNQNLNLLAEYLPIDILSSQVLEDALCNWQKSPSAYRYFGG